MAMDLKQWPRLNELLGAARGTRKWKEEKLAEIRREEGRTPEWKQQQTQKIVEKAREEIRVFKNEFFEELGNLKNESFRAAFGLHISGSDRHAQLMSWRDALGRAGQIKTQPDAQQALRRALLLDDETMANAVAFIGHDAGWNAVGEMYYAQYPKRATSYQEYLRFVEMESNSEFQLDWHAAFAAGGGEG